jgi:polar amino acid transport system substrate-binding protein
MIVDGLGVTMTIAVLAQLFGTVFGAFVCFVLTRKNRFVNLIGRFYCGLIHGTPIVVLLMITYYIIFGNTQISNVLIAVAAFTMVTGAGIAVNLKGAIDTIDPVEIEAARSIGFSAFRAFTTVTLPQAVKRALPGYTNGFVELVKATAIVGYIAIQDLTRAGDIIRSRTYDAYFPLLFVAVIYLTVTTICVLLFKFIVKQVNGRAGVN